MRGPLSNAGYRMSCADKSARSENGSTLNTCLSGLDMTQINYNAQSNASIDRQKRHLWSSI